MKDRFNGYRGRHDSSDEVVRLDGNDRLAKAARKATVRIATRLARTDEQKQEALERLDVAEEQAAWFNGCALRLMMREDGERPNDLEAAAQRAADRITSAMADPTMKAAAIEKKKPALPDSDNDELRAALAAAEGEVARPSSKSAAEVVPRRWPPHSVLLPPDAERMACY